MPHTSRTIKCLYKSCHLICFFAHSQRLLVDFFLLSGRKPDQSEAVVNEPTPAAAMRGNSGEYVAHEVKIVTPNTNLNPSPTPASPIGLQEGINQGDVPALSTLQGNNPDAPQQRAKNFGVAPSFLLVPKRRVLHNVRSNMKATVPGKLISRLVRPSYKKF